MDTKRKIDIMGIVNMTDDSYFAQSRCGNADAAVRRTGSLLSDGASIIDIGACSTRPGARQIGAEAEWDRLAPALEAISRSFPGVRISIDTYWASVVERAFGLIGDFIVNDISAGEDDPEMLTTAGRLGLSYIAMHKRGKPQTMQFLCDYTDVTAEVLDYFNNFSQRAAAAGIKNWLLDPGFGFAKTTEQNYRLLTELHRFRDSFPNRRILVGVSRKSMIYKPLGITPEAALPATQVIHLKALQCGADILRVHDAAAALQTVSLYRMLE